ncbi:MAG TPA: hypothetical protein VFI66_06305 [Gemmatimonadales bacterium]|nr:hypothetical protein [Gemmatimonadales bacterium]
MMRTVIGLMLALALPAMVAAQTPDIPNSHASDQGKAMVALHSQGAAHRATHRRGEVVPIAPTSRNPNAATPAVRATPAVPGHGVTATIPATPATPAVPAHKGGQSGSHRP